MKIYNFFSCMSIHHSSQKYDENKNYNKYKSDCYIIPLNPPVYIKYNIPKAKIKRHKYQTNYINFNSTKFIYQDKIKVPKKDLYQSNFCLKCIQENKYIYRSKKIYITYEHPTNKHMKYKKNTHNICNNPYYECNYKILHKLSSDNPNKKKIKT